jgi:hypothetical protein
MLVHTGLGTHSQVLRLRFESSLVKLPCSVRFLGARVQYSSCKILELFERRCKIETRALGPPPTIPINRSVVYVYEFNNGKDKGPEWDHFTVVEQKSKNLGCSKVQ